ncbi:MAG: ABC transporter substrate-binding protein [Phycicoccus sp.]|nr:ABC transporter substrate-binding protein [Phycicoccus sp.]
MTIKRKVTPLVALTAVALVASACATSDRSSDSSSSGSTGGDSTFTFGAAGAPKLFDPFYATDGETFRVSRQIFETLVDIKPGTADLAPGLATSWEPSADGKEWTFTLAEGVKFSDGTDFNGEAVCKNFERMFDQNEAGQAAAEYWADAVGAFKNDAANSLYQGCKAPDATTAVLTVSRATSKFPALLSLTAFSMQSPTAMDEGKANDVAQAGDGFTYPAYSQSPVGTGPYTLEKYDEANKTVTLVRNEDYHGEAAKNAKIVFKIIPDESTRRQELEAGSIDGYDLPNPVDWKGLEDAGNQVLVRPAFNILYLGLNPKAGNAALKDLKVRQALYHAINRDQLVKTQLPEGATVATQFMPDTVKGYNTSLEPYAYDPEKAKSLLAEAGQSSLTLTFAYPSEVSRPYMPDPQKIYDAIKTDFEAVGITVNTETKPWNGGYLDNVSGDKYDAYLLGWTGDYNSPDNFIGTFFGNLQANRFGTSDQDFGQALTDGLAKADGIVDEGEREKAYQDLNKQIMEEWLPGLAISHSPPAIVVSKNVTGLVASPLTAEKFNTVEVNK